VPAAGLLALCRLGQGVGLGGEWGGAVLLATENAPVGKRAWFGSFPQLGAPVGFFCATGVFLLMGSHLTEVELFRWGWRVPFLASAVLVLVGLYVRLQLAETPAFTRSVAQGERVRIPLLVVLAKHPRELLLGTLCATTIYTVFYLTTVFASGWATGVLGFGRQHFLVLQLFGVLFFALTIPLSAIIADRCGERIVLLTATLLTILFGFAFRPLFSGHSAPAAFMFLALGFALSGLAYGPLGSALANLFPTAVRYTGTSLSFNLAGILGASLAPPIATLLAAHCGVAFVGYYLSATGLVTLTALLMLKKSGMGALQ
jgi:MFS family permease